MRKVSSVEIKRRSNGKLIAASIVTSITIREAELTQIAWQKALNGYLKDIPKERWPEHTGWDWRRKHKKFNRLSAYKFYGIECDDQIQGLLLLSTLFRTSRLNETKGKEQQIIYGVYLEVAPWNLGEITPEPIYSLIGSVLIATAIEVSRKEGCEGRFGLHSLKQAEEFYKRCGMADAGIDEEHPERLRYFEMTKRAAQKFLPEV